MSANYFSLPNQYKIDFATIVCIHLLVILVSYLGFPNLVKKQIPPITIELGAAPAPSAGINAEKGRKTVNKANREAPKKPVDPAGQRTLPIFQEASKGGFVSNRPAAAPTSDVNKSLRVLKNVKPAYPPLAYKMRTEGTVVLYVEVLSSGRVGAVKIMQSSGSELLDESALDAIRLWEFTVSNSVTSSQYIKIPITFNLKSR